MKTCIRCHREQEIGQFYTHPKMADGHLSVCKECVKNRVRRHYRLTHAERSAYEAKRFKTAKRKAALYAYALNSKKNFPEKHKARTALTLGLRNGSIVRKPCAICGNPRSEGHHNDYSKPLEVEWLCFKHHRELRHGQTVVRSPVGIGGAN